MLEVEGLHAGYGRVPVLRDVSFTARPGEITLIVGENGAGKSTLLRAVAGFLAPTAGSVTLDGVELGGRKPEAIAALGGRLVLDGHRVFPDLSVRNNLRLGATVRRGKQPLDEAMAEVFGLFPILREKLAHPSRSLSGGQQQMLALAQAFVAAPRLLMCDEPSLGLARALMPPILQALRLAADRGAAVVVAEQLIDLVLPYAGQVLAMSRGRIVRACAASDYAASPSGAG